MWNVFSWEKVQFYILKKSVIHIKVLRTIAGVKIRKQYSNAEHIMNISCETK